MQTVMKTNNPATLSFTEVVLKDAEIEYFIMDQHMSLVEGSIGVIPRRLMVISDDKDAALRALDLAGLSKETFKG